MGNLAEIWSAAALKTFTRIARRAGYRGPAGLPRKWLVHPSLPFAVKRTATGGLVVAGSLGERLRRDVAGCSAAS